MLKKKTIETGPSLAPDPGLGALPRHIAEQAAADAALLEGHFPEEAGEITADLLDDASGRDGEHGAEAADDSPQPPGPEAEEADPETRVEEAETGAEEETLEDSYPDDDLVSGGPASVSASAVVPTLSWTPLQMQQLGATMLPVPDADDLGTMAEVTVLARAVAAVTSAMHTVSLIDHGYPLVAGSALHAVLESQAGPFVYEPGAALYEYDTGDGVYKDVSRQMVKVVTKFVREVDDEHRRIRQAVSVWPIKTAVKVLKALPKLLSPEATMNAVERGVYPIWQREEKMNGNPKVLNLVNGLLDAASASLRGHDPDHLSSIQLPYPFDPVAVCPTFDRYLYDAVPDPQVREVLQEWFGYSLIPTAKLQKALVLEGRGGTGKSTLVQILRKLVGEANCSAVTLDDLDDKFRADSLRGKLLNLVTEVNPAKALNDSRFKAYVSGDPVTTEQKFRDPGVFTPFARFVIAANELPRILDVSDAVYRRLIVVKFDQKFVAEPNPEAEQPERKADPDLITKIEAELPGVLNWALAGLARLNARGDFAIPQVLKDHVRAYRGDQNNAIRYITEECVAGVAFEVSTTDLYRAYEMWCKVHREKPFPSNVFGRVVSHYPGVEAKKSGSKGRYYKGLRPASAQMV